MGRDAGYVTTTDDLEVRIEDASVSAVLPELSRYCQESGAAISGISTVTDSLEQVFLRLTEKKG